MPARSEAEARRTLRKLDRQIAERSKYLKDQEKVIDEMVEQGGSRIMGLRHEVMLAEKELRDLKTDIRTMANDKRLLQQDLDDLRGSFPAYDISLANAIS